MASVAIEREELTEADQARGDATLRELQAAALDDVEYQDLIKAIVQGNKLPPGYKACEASLTTEDNIALLGQRLVVPKSMRKDVLKRLHASHQGIDRTIRRARQTVYWPGITSDIRSTVEACQQCQYYRPSQGREPMEQDPPPTRVFQDIAADFCELEGKHYLVIVDRYSGYPLIHAFNRPPNAEMTIEAMLHVFTMVGCPQRLYTDGGLQFTSDKTQQFLRRWYVDMRLSTAGYAQSNGLAESAVKAVKHLLGKCGGKITETFLEGLLELRNTPRAGGKSPAEIVYGHPARSRVPAHWKSFAKEWLTSMNDFDRKSAEHRAKAMEKYDLSSKTLPPLAIGDHVLIQDQHNKRWDKTGVITRMGCSRDYEIRMPSGRLVWRNRRFLRKAKLATSDELPGEERMSPVKNTPDKEKTTEEKMPKKRGRPAFKSSLAEKKNDELRRSKRVRIQTQRFGL